MKIVALEVRNFRSLSDVRLSCGDVLALVGRNNSGKSNVLRALQLLLEPSTSLLSRECFFQQDTTRSIEVIGTFGQLNSWEEEQLGPWLYDRCLKLGRRFSCNVEGEFDISTVAFTRVPEAEWLRDDAISGEAITQWWARKDDLKVAGLDFAADLGPTKPKVGEWKERAAAFLAAHRAELPTKMAELVNPKGYPNVLKGTLPHFVYVPAVRDLADEAKIQRTNPFGQLIASVLDRIPPEHKSDIDAQLAAIGARLNRSAHGGRLQAIAEMEQRLNTLMSELMKCDIEIEVAVPELRGVFAGTQIIADDGVRTPIGMKGHGLQRSMIFTILRHYAELVKARASKADDGGRTTLIAIEEPELYLHPQAQRTLLRVLSQIGDGEDQVFYSTHSDLMLDTAKFDNICMCRAVTSYEHRTSEIRQLSVAQLQKDLEIRKGVKAQERGIRELYMHAFGPTVNEGFFGDKVVLVEGPSEAYCLPIYSRALGFDLDRNNVAVVYADGKGQMDRLLRVFTGFGIPTFTWFDGDKTSSDGEVNEKTLELLELLGDPLASIDDLATRVTPSYAVLERNLEATLQSEIPDYEKYMAAARKALGPTGKPLKNRFLANQLTNGGVDGRAVPVTIARIVSAIAGLEYGGSLLKVAAPAAAELLGKMTSLAARA